MCGGIIYDIRAKTGGQRHIHQLGEVTQQKQKLWTSQHHLVVEGHLRNKKIII